MLDLVVAQALAAFTLALLGGLHCAGMCGGFVGALQLHRPPTVSATRLAAGYNAGRIVSYVMAGALVGQLGGVLIATRVVPLQVGLLLIGSAMLLAIGLSLVAGARWIRWLEPAGAVLWKRLAPLGRRVLPPRSGTQALAAGLLWGWIPCGMVYAALPLALVAGGPAEGAVVMLAFGLGTLPSMLAVDAAARHLVSASESRVAQVRRVARPLAAIVILIFGASGLAHAARVAGADHPGISALASICHR